MREWPTLRALPALPLPPSSPYPSGRISCYVFYFGGGGGVLEVLGTCGVWVVLWVVGGRGGVCLVGNRLVVGGE